MPNSTTGTRRRQNAPPPPARGPTAVSICADSVTPKPIRWLTPQFPLGKYSIIVGPPGLGKSLLTIDLAARISIGAPGPGSNKPTEAGDVVIVANEDDTEDTMVPRLISAGADLSRVHFLIGISSPDMYGIRPFVLGDVGPLNSLLAGLKNPQLVIIDPLGSYCGHVNANYDTEVRGLLMPLSELACRLCVSIIGILHFAKGTGKAVDKTMGSVAWVATARAAWGLIRDPEDSSNRLFLPIKCNLAKDISGLSFRIIDCDGDGAPRLAWSNEPETRALDDLLAEHSTKRAPKTTEAMGWLKSFLADGAAAQTTIMEAGGRLGYPQRTLNSAKLAIGAKSWRDGKLEAWFWALPEGGKIQEF